MSKTLFVVYHAPSLNTQRMLEALCSCDLDSESSVSVIQKRALECDPDDVINADAIILLTPENLGYMSGAMKDFFDRCYSPCLEIKQGLPVSAVVRAGHDGTGTVRALKTILTGLKWRWVQEPIVCRGEWQESFIEQCSELGQAMSASLEMGII